MIGNMYIHKHILDLRQNAVVPSAIYAQVIMSVHEDIPVLEQDQVRT